MNWFVICIATIYGISALVRLVRWVAILQQKEYRFDRVRVFLLSSEGNAEFLRLLPSTSDFSRTGFKRPKLTQRAIVSALLSFGELLTLIFTPIIWYLRLEYVDSVGAILLLSIWLLFILVSIPLLVLLTAVPTSLVAQYQTMVMCRSAAKLLDFHTPLVIGITGSYGKSSTKQLLAHVLSKKYRVFATPRSFNTRYSVAQSIVIGYRGEEIVILEYGAYGPGEIRKLVSDLPANWAVITGFAPQHLGLFGSEDAILRAKAELLEALPPDGKAFVNGDDSGVQRIVSVATIEPSVPVLEFSVYSVPALKKTKLSSNGSLEIPYTGKLITTNLVGKHYVQTIAGVWAIAAELGMSEKSILSQLKSFVPTDTFMQRYVTRNAVTILDDGGTSNPRGFAAALEVLEQLEFAQKILITPGIVDLGNQSNSIHLELAKQAWSVGVSEVLYVGENGKGEFSTVFSPNRVLSERSAVQTALTTMPSGSVLLIEGRLPGWCEDILKQLL